MTISTPKGLSESTNVIPLKKEKGRWLNPEVS